MILTIFLSILPLASGLLYPIENKYRSVKSLNGLWSFVREELNTPGYGFANRWYSKDLALNFKNYTKLPVPSAYNDLVQDRSTRDHVGWVWYQRKINPFIHKHNRVILRFGSVNYFTSVFLDTDFVGNHTGGHVPFEFDITHLLVNRSKKNKKRLLTVAVNNTLSHHTVPQGEFQYKTDSKRFPPGFFTSKPDFDFFNYAGILRDVWLYTVPKSVSIHCQQVIAEQNGMLIVHINASHTENVQAQILVRTLDDQLLMASTVVGATDQSLFSLKLNLAGKIQSWWPLGMGEVNVGQLYVLQTLLLVNKSKIVDSYETEIGFRTITYDNSSIYINGNRFYCHGFGMHEDVQLRGRGFDLVTMIKDLNVFEWLGGNCYRTSHYPYDEQRYFEADRRGIMMIDETPAVGLRVFDDANLNIHMDLLTTMIKRDRNHPCVLAWSIANEPQTYQAASRPYFKSLVDAAHSLDSTRPVVSVYGPSDYTTDVTADMMDLFCVNRYYGWYESMGYLNTIKKQLIVDLRGWHNKFNKTIILTEYGAGAIEGINFEPSLDFAVSYQNDVLHETHKALDVLRQEFLAGEMVWHFADFMTDQATNRVAGNRKGVLTRNRQPKMAAYLMKKRYSKLNNVRCDGAKTASVL